MPFQGEKLARELRPRALPWAESVLALQAAVDCGVLYSVYF